MRQSSLEITLTNWHTVCVAIHERWDVWTIRSGVSLKCVFSYSVSQSQKEEQRFLEAYSGRQQLCVLYRELHILAGIYFALGGFPWLCHMLHVSSRGRGAGIMQGTLSLTGVCVHTPPRRYWLCLIQPASAPSLSLMGWEMAVTGGGMINTTCWALPLENENLDLWPVV